MTQYKLTPPHKEIGQDSWPLTK